MNANEYNRTATPAAAAQLLSSTFIHSSVTTNRAAHRRRSAKLYTQKDNYNVSWPNDAERAFIQNTSIERNGTLGECPTW